MALSSAPPFVLSWFLERHKQAWNLFYPPLEKKKKNGRHPSLFVHNSALWTSEFDPCFVARLCLSRRSYLRWKEGTFISNWTWDVGPRGTVNSLITVSYLTTDTQSLSTDKHIIMCQRTAVGRDGTAGPGTEWGGESYLYVLQMKNGCSM